MQFFCENSFQTIFEKYVDIHNCRWYYKTMEGKQTTKEGGKTHDRRQSTFEKNLF